MKMHLIISMLVLVLFLVGCDGSGINLEKDSNKIVPSQLNEQSVSKITEEVDCKVDIGLNFIQLNNNEMICYGVGDTPTQTSLYMLLENGPSTNIVGLQITYIGEKGTNITENLIKIPKAHITTLNLTTFDNEVLGNPRAVKIIPMMWINGTNVLCANNALQKETIVTCAELS